MLTIDLEAAEQGELRWIVSDQVRVREVKDSLSQHRVFKRSVQPDAASNQASYLSKDKLKNFDSVSQMRSEFEKNTIRTKSMTAASTKRDL